MFQNFQISVTPLENNRYLIRTEDVETGVRHSEETVTWQVEEWLEEAQHLMNDPLLRLFQSNGWQENLLFPPPSSQGLNSQAELNLITFGQKLYDALFYRNIRDSWITAQAIAQNQRAVLRLRLGLKGDLLPRIPWEVIYLSQNQTYETEFRPLAAGTDIAFSRYHYKIPLSKPNLLLQPQSEATLRILMVIAGPEDQEMLQLHQEAIHLQQELATSTSSQFPAIKLNILENPNREELTQALEQGHYHIFHYSGHSDLGDSGGNIYLVSRTTGLTETLYGDDLAGLLVNNGIQLAIFNSCHGGDTALIKQQELLSDRNLAQALVKKGIPAVLAMAARIPDQVALTLTRLLYRNLNQGYPIDFSLGRARQGLISSYSSQQLYWALPVLYLHPDFDGILTHHLDEQDFEQLFKLNDFERVELTDEEKALLNIDNPNQPSVNGNIITPKILVSANNHSNGNGHHTSLASLETEEQVLISELLADLAQDSGLIDEIESGEELTTPSNPKLVSDTATLANPEELRDLKSPFINQWSRYYSKKPSLIQQPIFLIVTAFCLVMGGAWLISNQFRPNIPQNALNTTVHPEKITKPEGIDLDQANTNNTTDTAIRELSQGNLNTGIPAVIALLDRNAIPSARAALDNVPLQLIEKPEITFLKGRLAWQAVQAGNKDFDIADARRYWEITVKNKPDSLEYLNALGFAYYAEGKYNQANQKLYDALDLYKNQSSYPPEILHSYAGLALGLRKLAEKQSGQQQQLLINQSLQLRQKVMSSDATNFSGQTLSKNWLWTEKMIQDWESILPHN